MKHMVLVITMTFMSLVIIRLYEKQEDRAESNLSIMGENIHIR